jgi:hypothetical protein
MNPLVLPVLVSTLAGTVLGALIAWLLTHVYARLAVRDLRKQREQLERQTRTLTTFLKAWEEQGSVELLRNDRGEITGGRLRLPSGTAALPDRSGPDPTGAARRL